MWQFSIVWLKQPNKSPDSSLVCQLNTGNLYGKTCESWIPPSPNLDKVTASFDKLNKGFDMYPIYIGKDKVHCKSQSDINVDYKVL